MLQRLIREHEEKTASPRARTILVQWDEFLPLFRKVAPKDAAALVAGRPRRVSAGRPRRARELVPVGVAAYRPAGDASAIG